MMCAARLSNIVEYISDYELNKIESLLKKAGFDLKIPNDIDRESLINKMYTDKKVLKGKVRFVLLNKIGEVKQFENGSYSTEVNETLIEKVIDEQSREQ